MVRLTDRPDMTLDVYRGHKTTIQQQQGIASDTIPSHVPFFLLVSLLDGYSFANVLVKGIVAFKH